MKSKNILVTGCGLLGGTLAGVLSAQMHNVTIIDENPDSFRKLPPAYGGFKVTGDATEVKLLEKAGIETADMVIATTERDNVNSMVGQIAKTVYNVAEVYIRLYDVSKEEILSDTGIQVILPSKLSLQEFQVLSGMELKEV
ncbi:MAG: TrkA family potassium uptake protein [Anaerovorax sp.]